MDIATSFGETIYAIAGMSWKILWALVLGFAISGAIQAFVPKRRMAGLMGDSDAQSLSRATFFGAISSSCSYAAAAMSRSVFLRGAHIIPALAFMVAATNLVIELGLVLWSLMGWQFVIAEFAGGFLLISIMALLMRTLGPVTDFNKLRESEQDQDDEDAEMPRITTLHGWRIAASRFVMDWKMIWKDVAIGVTVAGILMVWVPSEFWQALFLAGDTGAPYWLRIIENAFVGPLVAMFSFVCSVGNIPLAAVLFNSGISFGGALAFIYGDLIAIPMILVYRKYYGWKLALWVAGILYVAMVFTGIVMEVLFHALGWIPEGHLPVVDRMQFFAFDYTLWLNLIFIMIGLLLYWLARGVNDNGEDCCHHE